MSNKILCPHCGSDMVANKGYNYDTSYLDYECEECGNQFTNNDVVYCDECGSQVIEDNRIDYDGLVFCSKECAESYKKN